MLPLIRRTPLCIIRDPVKSTSVTVKGGEDCTRSLGSRIIRGGTNLDLVLGNIEGHWMQREGIEWDISYLLKG